MVLCGGHYLYRGLCWLVARVALDVYQRRSRCHAATRLRRPIYWLDYRHSVGGSYAVCYGRNYGGSYPLTHHARLDALLHYRLFCIVLRLQTTDWQQRLVAGLLVVYVPARSTAILYVAPPPQNLRTSTIIFKKKARILKNSRFTYQKAWAASITTNITGISFCRGAPAL